MTKSKTNKKVKVKMQTAEIVAAAPPAHWRNIASRMERVAMGTVIPVQVQGGWVRKPAPCSGYVIYVEGNVDNKADDTAIFIPDSLPA